MGVNIGNNFFFKAAFGY